MNDDDQGVISKGSPAPGVACTEPEGKGPGMIVAGAAARAAVGAETEPPSGGVASGQVGNSVAAATAATRECAYWSENFHARHYVESGSSFKDYGPAYGFGVDARGRYPGRDFDDVESELSSDWVARRGASSLSWARARPAVRDAWNRIGPPGRVWA